MSVPRIKRVADFDTDATPTITAPVIATLASVSYSGTGKSHLLIGLRVAACEQARRVRYATAAQLVNELAEAADERSRRGSWPGMAISTFCALDELRYGAPADFGPSGGRYGWRLKGGEPQAVRDCFDRWSVDVKRMDGVNDRSPSVLKPTVAAAKAQNVHIDMSGVGL